MIKRKVIIAGILMGTIALLLVGIVAAEGCFLQMSRGDQIISMYGRMYTCEHTSCTKCVNSSLSEITWNQCDKACDFPTNNTPPETNLVLTINSPVAGIFNKSTQMIDIKSNLPASMTMYDSFSDKTTKLCSNCYAYDGKKSFKDGQHALTFTASRDSKFSVKEVSFFIDSKKPKISKTLPKKGFASGLFEVEIQEANPEKLELNYGNSAVGFRKQEINLASCQDIKGNSEKKACSVEVDLEAYDSQPIEYWFYLKDIAQSFVESKHLLLQVDTTFPKAIDNTNYNIIGKYVYFNISVEEENLDEVFYTYTDSRGALKEKRLCSKLNDGRCVKKVSFSLGQHDLTLNVIDKASNLIGWPVSFDVV